MSLWRRKLRGWELNDEQTLGEIVTNIIISANKDKVFWSVNNGAFCSKELYKKFDQDVQINGPWNLSWRLKVPARIKMFAWKIGISKLPV